MKEVVLIPEERVNVVKDKEVKEKIEKELDVKLVFYSNTIEIEGEGLNLFSAKTIVKAIGRGFSPQNAFKLLDENEQLEIIDLKNLGEKKLKIIKARLIGTNGKTRKLIEKYSSCAISVYGKTVSIIGNYEQIQTAKEAVEMIIRGSKHTIVYRYLQEHRVL